MNLSANVRQRILERLRRQLQLHNMTHDDLAAALSHVEGCSRSNIAAWFTGSRPIQAYHAVHLAQLFGVTTDYLLGMDEEPAPAADELDERINEIQNEIKDTILEAQDWAEAGKRVDRLRNELNILQWRRKLAARKHSNTIPIMPTEIERSPTESTAVPKGVEADYAVAAPDDRLAHLGIRAGDLLFVQEPKYSAPAEGDLVLVVRDGKRVVRKHTPGTKVAGTVVGAVLHTRRSGANLPHTLEDKLAAARNAGMPDEILAASLEAAIALWRGQAFKNENEP